MDSQCKFFLWLAALQSCWTADRLQKRGLEHPDSCPLCDQEPETIDHLLADCVFTRQLWFRFLGQVNLQDLPPPPPPQLGESNFMGSWRKVNDQVQGIAEKGLNSLIILGFWTLWNHRNGGTFDRTTPSVDFAIRRAEEERELWEMAGANT